MFDESLDITSNGSEYQLKPSSFLRSVTRASDAMLANKLADHSLSTGANTTLLAVVLIIHILVMTSCADILRLINRQSGDSLANLDRTAPL